MSSRLVPGSRAPVIRASSARLPISTGRLPSRAIRLGPVRIAAHWKGVAVSTMPTSEMMRRGPSSAARRDSTVARSATSGASPAARRSRPLTPSRSQGSPVAVAVPAATPAPSASSRSAIRGAA
ncbi:hypothetical protein ACRBEV_17350 [Methylobacterium phyllosphaerae]